MFGRLRSYHIYCMAGLLTDRVALDEYMGVWFRYEVSEAMEVSSIGISFRTELQEKIASRRHVIQYLENVGATSGWLMCLNRDQEDDVSLLGLLDTFVDMMYEIVRKRGKLHMQAANAFLQMLAYKCKLHMQAANACLQMLAANAGCKCLLANAKASCKFKVQILDENRVHNSIRF
ncbi:hypothetical protein Tco_0156376 [Tanacetum coccineum]